MRVKLKIPDFFHFETLLKIRVSDLNYGGHLGNDSFLTLAHESRVQFFKSINMTERNFFGRSLIMADSIVIYKSQAFLGDEINIKISITNCRSHGFQLFYLFQKKQQKLDLAHIQTSMVFYDYNEEKILPFPQDFSNYIKNFK
jgi:acyl-CoA thioesterase FadM